MKGKPEATRLLNPKNIIFTELDTKQSQPALNRGVQFSDYRKTKEEDDSKEELKAA